MRALEYPFAMRALTEPVPGPAWTAHFADAWPGYRRWYLDGTRPDRPNLRTAVRMLARYMPELMPTYLRLVELAGGDETAARMLTLWDPPRFSPGCSQLASSAPDPMLCRNYDYSPHLFEGVVASTAYTSRRVLGTADCLWGLIDGMNDAGLAVSLTFGGRPGSGRGFGVPLVLRYLLEVATTTAEACAVLRRVPVSMSYNLTLVDAAGIVRTVFVGPDEPPEVSELVAVANHRGAVPEFPEQARALRSVERLQRLEELAASHPDPATLVAAFLAKPLYNSGFSRAFGTLYTALYRPTLGYVDYCWPGNGWRRTFDAPAAVHPVIWREDERLHVR
jgi:predicted choloylglycine hydrolase